jgi:ferredoxin--NADP+ reductase
MTVSVAIVGSGPAGFYAVEALLKSEIDCSIDIIERLPTPFGLIRFGVAPDHQTTKNVARAFALSAEQPEVSFFGNVELGRHVTLADLRQDYDAVILAVGAAKDRALGIPGEDKAGVIGSAEFVGWFNGHPDFADLAPDLNTECAVVVGNGNVAIDIARVLVKTPEEMRSSDLPAHAAAVIHAAPLHRVHIIGRRGPLQAKFTNVELREMGELQNALPVVDPAQLPDSVPETLSKREQRLVAKNLATFREFAEMQAEGRGKRVHFDFFTAPVEVLGGDKVEGLRVERTRLEGGRAVGTGETFDLPCGLVFKAIGYSTPPLPEVPFDEAQGRVLNREGRVTDSDGKVQPGVYVVGWAMRGPTGVISSSRADGRLVAEHIAADLGAGGKPGGRGLLARLQAAGCQPVSFEDWQRIEAAEEAAAPTGAPRCKFVRVDDMLALLAETADA